MYHYKYKDITAKAKAKIEQLLREDRSLMASGVYLGWHCMTDGGHKDDNKTLINLLESYSRDHKINRERRTR